ncbi:hypothetical protein FB451DRAFT_1518419 [Mycena latifolia]|nr:hypothetical protein FB451DRAFT_1518419 [Mycena latifolia]
MLRQMHIICCCHSVTTLTASPSIAQWMDPPQPKLFGLHSPLLRRIAVAKQRIYKYKEHCRRGRWHDYARQSRRYYTCFAIMAITLSVLYAKVVGNVQALTIAVTALDAMFGALIVHRMGQRKSVLRQPAPPERLQTGPTVNITILGPFPKPVSLNISRCATIAHIAFQLRHRHLIPDLTRVKHHILFPKRQWAPLKPTDILDEVGIKDLSVLHLRMSVLGGSQQENNHQGEAENSQSTKRSGQDNNRGEEAGFERKRESSHKDSNKSFDDLHLNDRITNSPLVAELPWTVDGIGDETWHSSWLLRQFHIPQPIQFQSLLENIKRVTGDHLSPNGIAKEQFARWFFGFDATIDVKTRLLPKSLSVFALQVINFLTLRLELGMTPRIGTNPRCQLPDGIQGRTAEILTQLEDWPSIVQAACDVFKASLAVGESKADIPTPSEHHPTCDQNSAQLSALLSNLVENFRPSAFELILRNLRFAAFAIGWFCQGTWNVPTKLCDILDKLKTLGFVGEVGGEVRQNFNKVKDILAPLKLALSLSWIVLLIPWGLANYSFPEDKLIKIFQSFGNEAKPEWVQYCETKIQDAVWALSQGLKPAVQACFDLLQDLKRVPWTSLFSTDKSWFKATTPSSDTNNTPAIDNNSEYDMMQYINETEILPDETILCEALSSDSQICKPPADVESMAPPENSLPNPTEHLPPIQSWLGPTNLDIPCGLSLLGNASGSDITMTTSSDILTVDPKLLTGDSSPPVPYTESSSRPSNYPSGPSDPPTILAALPLTDSMTTRGEDVIIATKKRKHNLGWDDLSDLSELSQSEGESEASYQSTPKKRRPKKAKKAENNENSIQLESDDEDIQEIPFIDLTGDDDSLRPQVKTFNRQHEVTVQRDTAGIIITLYSANKSSKSRHPRTLELEQSKDNEYCILSEIQDSFFHTFILKAPRYHLDSALNPEFVEGCSIFYVTDLAGWLALNPATRQRIFEHRHIVIKGLMSHAVLQIGFDAFDFMGVRLGQYLPTHDLSLRTADKPTGGITFHTPNEFLREAARHKAHEEALSKACEVAGADTDKEPCPEEMDTKTASEDRTKSPAIPTDGKVYNMLDIPMDGTNIPDPEGFKDLSTSDAAFVRTRSMPGCQYAEHGSIDKHTKWGLATIAGAMTPVHLDRFATMIIIMAGAKMWYNAIATPFMNTINAFRDFEPFESGTQDRAFEGILLEAGDIMFMRPDTPHCVVTTDTSIAWGRHFHAESTMPDSVRGFIHTALLDQALTNASHDGTSIYFIQIQAFWFANFKLIREGAPVGSHTLVHIPQIGTWKGLLWMLYVGNLVMFLDALDYRNYLSDGDLTEHEIASELLRRAKTQEQHRLAYVTFKNFRAWFTVNYEVQRGGAIIRVNNDIFEASIVHLAVVLAFYKRVKTTVKPMAKGWTSEAFEMRLKDALHQYSGKRLTEKFDAMMNEATVPAGGCFLPHNWTENTFTVEEKHYPNHF